MKAPSTSSFASEAAGILPPSRQAAIALVLLGSLCGACATQGPFVWVQDLPAQSPESGTVINARDTIVVHVRDQLPMSGEFIVRDDGGYLQPSLGNVQVAGRTTGEVAAELQARLENLIVKPQVGVSVARAASVRVNVVGEVRTPGVYELSRDRTVMAALAAAGWLTDFAARDGIFVLRSGETRIRFRAADLTTPGPHASRFRLRDGDVVVVE
ncbi:MAG: polysaccharide biosynthesis/export family protein [Bacteroidota bacterium]